MLEQELGRTISYESISPSVLNFLEVRNLKIHKHDSPKDYLVSIQKLRIHYNILTLLFRDSTTSFTKISLRNSDITFNAKEDRDILNLIEDLAASTEKAPMIDVSGKNVSFTMHSKIGTARLERLFFEISSENRVFSTSMKGKALFHFREPKAGFENIETYLNISGRIDRTLEWSDLRASFSHFQSNLFSLEKQSFQVNLREDTWEIWKIQERSPINLRCLVKPSRNSLEFSFAADHFQPLSMIHAEKDLAVLEPWLSTIITGNGELSYNYETREISYSADVEAIVDNKIVPTELQVAGLFEGNSRKADIEALKVYSDYGNYYYRGSLNLKTFYPTGSLQMYRVPYITGEYLRASFHIKPDGERVSIAGNRIAIGEVTLEDTFISVLPYQNSVDFTLLAHVKDTFENKIEIDGNVQLRPDIHIQIGAETKNITLRDLAQLSVPSSIVIPEELTALQEYTLDSKIYLTSDLDKFAFACPSITIRDPENVSNTISFSMAGNNRSIELHEIDVQWNDYSAGGYVTSSFSQKGEISFSSSLHFEGHPFSFYGLYLPDESLTVHGNYGFSLEAVRSHRRYLISLDTEDLPIPLVEGISEVSLHMSGYFANKSDWEIVSKNSRVTNLPVLESRENEITFSARITPEEGRIYNVHYQDEFSELQGNGEIDYAIGKNIRTDGWFQLKSPEGNENYSAVFDYRGATLDTQIAFSEAPISRFSEMAITGDLSGQVHVSGPLDHPEIKTHLRLQKGQLNNDPFSFETSVAILENEITLEGLSLQYLNNKVFDGNGSYDFETGDYRFSSSFATTFQSKQLRSAIVLQGATASVEKRSQLSQVLNNDFSGSLEARNVFWGNQSLDPLFVEFSQKEKEIRISGGPQNSIDATYLREGKFQLDLVEPLPVVLDATGELREGNIDASVTIDLFDIEALNTFLNIPFFNLRKGNAYGEIAITGPVNDPDVNGTLYVKRGVAKNSLIPPDMGPFDTEINFQGKEFSITDLVIPVEDGNIQASADFILDHWIPNNYDIRVSTLGSSVVPIESTFGRMHVNGYGSADLHIVGDFAGVEISGSVQGTAMTVTLREAQSQEEDGGDQFNYSVDLTINTGRRVEFLWPTENLPILRTQIASGQQAEIDYDSATGDLSLVGTIEVQSGQVYYFSRSFYIRDARIIFNENEDNFDPVLDARAELREITSTGQDVSIYLVVDKRPLSNFSPQFESDPPLATTEIFALMGQRLITDIGGEEFTIPSAIVHTGGFFFGQLGFIRSFEEKIKEIFQLDLFSIRTQMLENLVLAGVFGEDAPAIDTPLGTTVGKYLDNTTVFLGKYLSEDLFLEAMVSLRLRDFPYSNLSFGEEFVIDTEISIEWDTPIALLELTLVPNVQDFLQELPYVKLALSWGFTF